MQVVWRDIERAFETVSRERADALVVSGENFFITQGSLIVALAARYAVPTMYPYSRFAAMGGLVSYGVEDQRILTVPLAPMWVAYSKEKSRRICRCSN